MRVLIVDDDADIAKVVALTLEVTYPGSEIRIESDGQSGLDGFDKDEDDLVILDVGLPDIDGFEVCRRIREISNVPIIMVTGRDLVEDKVTGLTGGADDYVVKPFTTLEFTARVQAVLRRVARESDVSAGPQEPVTPPDVPKSPSDRLVRYLKDHPEGVHISSLDQIVGLSGMELIRLVARLVDAHEVRYEYPLVFIAEE